MPHGRWCVLRRSNVPGNVGWVSRSGSGGRGMAPPAGGTRVRDCGEAFSLRGLPSRAVRPQPVRACPGAQNSIPLRDSITRGVSARDGMAMYVLCGTVFQYEGRFPRAACFRSRTRETCRRRAGRLRATGKRTSSVRPTIHTLRSASAGRGATPRKDTPHPCPRRGLSPQTGRPARISDQQFILTWRSAAARSCWAGPTRLTVHVGSGERLPSLPEAGSAANPPRLRVSRAPGRRIRVVRHPSPRATRTLCSRDEPSSSARATRRQTSRPLTRRARTPDTKR